MYETNQLCLEVPTDKYIQFISKLDRNHGRMLEGLQTEHYLQYMLHKVRRVKPSLYRRCGAKK